MPATGAFSSLKWTRSPKDAIFPCLAVRQPEKDVHIVAGFLHDEGAGGVAPPPVSPDERVREAPAADIFVVLNGDDLSQFPAVHDLLELTVKIGVSQHMAYGDFPARFFSFHGDCQAFPRIGRNRLFQKDIVTFVHCRHSLAEMIPVQGGDDDRLAQSVLGKKIFRAGPRRSMPVSWLSLLSFDSRVRHALNKLFLEDCKQNPDNVGPFIKALACQIGISALRRLNSKLFLHSSGLFLYNKLHIYAIRNSSLF